MRKKFFLTTIIAAFILCSCAEGSKTVADNMSIEEESNADEEDSVSEASSKISLEASIEAASEEESNEEASEDVKKEITVITHKDPCTIDGEEYAEGAYPEVILSDEFKEKYPKMAKYIKKTNKELKDKNLATIAWYGPMAKDAPMEYEDELSIYIYRVDEKLFSYYLFNYNYSGGAHCNSYVDSYNIDPVSGDKIRLDQVLDDSSGFSAAIIKELKENFPQHYKESTDYQGEEAFADELNEMLNEDSYTFFVDDKGITIHFDSYDLASYATGEAEATLLYDKYPNLIKKEFIMEKAQNKENLAEYIENTEAEIVEPTDDIPEKYRD